MLRPTLILFTVRPNGSGWRATSLAILTKWLNVDAIGVENYENRCNDSAK